MNEQDDMNSVMSGFSQISVNGEEVSADVAVDQGILDIQQGLNNAQYSINLLIMRDYRDEDNSYDETLPDYEKVYTALDELVALVKDLKKITRQVQPRKARKTAAQKKLEAESKIPG